MFGTMWLALLAPVNVVAPSYIIVLAAQPGSHAVYDGNHGRQKGVPSTPEQTNGPFISKNGCES
jgi:hypothetical protein